MSFSLVMTHDHESIHGVSRSGARSAGAAPHNTMHSFFQVKLIRIFLKVDMNEQWLDGCASTIFTNNQVSHLGYRLPSRPSCAVVDPAARSGRRAEPRASVTSRHVTR